MTTPGARGLPLLICGALRPHGGRANGGVGAGSHCGSCGHLGLSPQIDLYAGALFVHICLGWNFYLSTILMLVITALYTIAGTAPRRARMGLPQRGLTTGLGIGGSEAGGSPGAGAGGRGPPLGSSWFRSDSWGLEARLCWPSCLVPQLTHL